MIFNFAWTLSNLISNNDLGSIFFLQLCRQGLLSMRPVQLDQRTQQTSWSRISWTCVSTTNIMFKCFYLPFITFFDVEDLKLASMLSQIPSLWPSLFLVSSRLLSPVSYKSWPRERWGTDKNKANKTKQKYRFSAYIYKKCSWSFNLAHFKVMNKDVDLNNF